VNLSSSHAFHPGRHLAQHRGLVFRDFAEENDIEIPSPVNPPENHDLSEQGKNALGFLRFFPKKGLPQANENPESFRDVDLGGRNEMTPHGAIGPHPLFPEDFGEMILQEIPRGSFAL
jgi:hypothetical protein